MDIIDRFDNNIYYLDLVKPYLEEYLKEYKREVFIRLIKSPQKRIIREFKKILNVIKNPVYLFKNLKPKYFENISNNMCSSSLIVYSRCGDLICNRFVEFI